MLLLPIRHYDEILVRASFAEIFCPAFALVFRTNTIINQTAFSFFSHHDLEIHIFSLAGYPGIEPGGAHVGRNHVLTTSQAHH